MRDFPGPGSTWIPPDPEIADACKLNISAHKPWRRRKKSQRGWLERLGVQTMYIEPGSPWENGYIESFNGKMRDVVLNREVFDTIVEAKVLVERCRVEYNHILPHSSLGYRPPAPEVIIPLSG